VAEPLSIRDLRDQLAKLDRLRGVDRARLARELSDVALASLQAAGDEGVYQATRRTGPTSRRPYAGRTYAAVAEELGGSVGRVNVAVSRHIKRHGDGG
jgi:hypothetical protein